MLWLRSPVRCAQKTVSQASSRNIQILSGPPAMKNAIIVKKFKHEDPQVLVVNLVACKAM